MSRRGGKRRQVLQLGDSSSKLHRYGYSKGFQPMESSVQTNLVTGLVGDYSDSDSDSNSNSDQKTVTDLPPQPQAPPTAKDEPLEGTPPPPLPVVQEPVASVKNDAPKEDPMDDELRNFLSEIEAIPMPDESKTPEHLSEGGPSPTPTNQSAVAEKGQGDATLEDSTATSKMASSGVSKKMSGAYSMFVKGDVEFAHSPSSTPPVVSEAVDESQDRTKPADGAVTDSDFANIPEEPTTCWQMVQDENTQYYYYWNWKTNQVTWEIPSDYTQYLLLHKEYKEKMAKVPPHVLQAWKERKAGKEKVTSDNQSNGHSTKTMERDFKSLSKNSLSADLTTASAKIHSERKDEEGDDRYSHHHHRKKKSKKHKRRRNSSSDEDLDEKYLRSSEDSASVKSSLKSKKSKPVIGPQPLSIVPYMSDDNDEDSGNDGDSVKAKDEVVQSNTESSRVESTSSPVRTKTSGSTSPVPVPVSGDSMETETVKPDFESLVQNLVEFHDKMTLPGKRGDLDDSISVTDNVKEMDLDGVEMKNDNGRENEEGLLTNSVSGEVRKEEPEGEDLQKENEATNDSESSEVCDNTSSSKEKERQNIFDQFSVIQEKKQKKKKKVINMFAEDSQSEIDENVENKDSNVEGVSKSASVATLKSEMEDGELSDGSESLTRNAEVSKDTNHKRGKTNTTTKADTTKSSDKQQTSSIKGIVGYSEEDEEEEEGELKEEGETTSKAKETSADNEVVSEPKKRVLQYKDYMKKYRSGSDKSTSNSSSNDNVHSSNNEDGKKDTSVTVVKEVNHSPSPTPPSHSGGDSKSCVEDVSREEKEAIVQPPVATNVVVEEKMDEEEVVEKKQAEVENGGGEDDDSEDDFDLDDLDNIDRVLEKALEKKRDQKTEIKEETVVKSGDQTEASSHVPSTTPSLAAAAAETKKTETDRLEAVESSVDGSAMSETDMKRLKYAVKDSAELALHKLQFLDISTKNLSKLQVLLVELQTRYNDWQSGGLSTQYFHNQLKSSEALLSQYEESAVPPGWSCQWDRASCRYFYRNEQSGHTQWEYPQIGGGGTGAAAAAEGPSSSTAAAATTTTAASSSSLSKVKGGEVKDAGGGSGSGRGRSSKTKRRSKDADEREESSSKSRGHNSSSRSSRSHRSNKKGTEKDRGKRDRHASSSHHHRKKKRRRRDHSSSSSSSEEESTHSSRHRHRSKRKKRGRSDKSPSLELIDYEGPETVQVIEDSPPAKDPGGDRTGSSDDGGLPTSHRPLSATLGLIADYGSDQDMDEDDDNDEEKETTGAPGEERIRKRGDGDVVGLVSENGVSAEEKSRGLEEGEVDGIDGVEMRKGGAGDEMSKEEEEDREEEQEEAAEEEEVNNAVIVKPPQIIVPPYVAAMNQPQLYSASALYASAPVPSSTTTMTAAATTVAPPDYAEQEHELGETTSASAATSHAAEDTDKATKKKKKEKSLNANSSIMMKKKRVSSMVQKWQQVKKEVEKENRDKELRQAAIREKINQLKSST